jgi:hypothetical protein
VTKSRGLRGSANELNHAAMIANTFPQVTKSRTKSRTPSPEPKSRDLESKHANPVSAGQQITHLITEITHPLNHVSPPLYIGGGT